MPDQTDQERDQGVVKYGQTPQFPGHVEAGEGHDKDAIADAAWQHSGGSIEAFERFCRDHVAGVIDLFKHEIEQHPSLALAMRMPVAADMRALKQAANGDLPLMGAPAPMPGRERVHDPMQGSGEAQPAATGQDPAVQQEQKNPGSQAQPQAGVPQPGQTA